VFSLRYLKIDRSPSSFPIAKVREDLCVGLFWGRCASDE
jgi:hypothetical protein